MDFGLLQQTQNDSEFVKAHCIDHAFTFEILKVLQRLIELM